MAGRPGRRESPSERRERRAAVDDPAVVLEAAGRFLETRSRSVAEVRRRLTRAGYRPALVDDAVTRLIELGILDDEAFARAWVESRDRARPRGARAIRTELLRLGVERAVVDAVIVARAEAADADGSVGADRAAADRLLARHARALERVAEPRARRQKAYGLLARNGFDPDTCREAAAGFVTLTVDDDPG